MPTLVEDSYYLVQRGGFDADGLTRESGEIVDTATWRNVQPLVNIRKLAPCPKPHEDLVQCACGRTWVDEGARDKHACPAREKSEVKESKSKSKSVPAHTTQSKTKTAA